MSVEGVGGGTSVIDVLDRVLDKGIVIDARARVSPVGIDLIAVDARIIVASLDPYIGESATTGNGTPEPRPAALPA